MKRFWISFLLLLVLTVAVWAAISIDGTPDNFTESATDTVHTSASLTIANNPNRLLVVPFGTSVSISTPTVTFNSVGLTLVPNTHLFATGGSATGDVFYTTSQPGAVTSNVNITISASGRLLQMPISLYNVDTASPIRDSKSESGTTGIAASLTLATAINDWCLSCAYVRRDSGLDPGNLVPTSGAELEELNNSCCGSAGSRFSCSWQVATTTSTVVGWGWTASNGWVHTAVAFKPISTGNSIYYTKMMNQ